MRVAIVGSRSLRVNISAYIPEGTTEIVSGGAAGIDTLAEAWADAHNIPKLIFRPDYENFGGVAPFLRNKLIAEAADFVLAIWDGKSAGTMFTVDYAKQLGIPVQVVVIDGQG